MENALAKESYKKINLDDPKEARDKLNEIKDNIQNAYLYFKENIEKFNSVRRFVFLDNLETQQRDDLTKLDKPPLQANSLESYISRNRGEFVKQEPSIQAHPAPDRGYVQPPLLQMISGHFKSILEDSKSSLTQFNAYTEALCGFSVLEVYPEYENEMSFNQKICLRKCEDVTMVFFDPNAREVTKKDSEYCAKVYPMTEEEFKSYYPDVDISRLQYDFLGDFQWTYRRGKKKIVLLCKYYEKTYDRVRLILLENNQSVTEKEYDQLKKFYEERGMSTQIPMEKSRRWTHICKIKEYIIITDKILECNETPYKDLPYIFVDGNSVYLPCDGNDSAQKQHIKPYIMQAMDTQRVKNLLLQTFANEVENLVGAKWIAPIEAVPENYMHDYINIQKLTSVLLYNGFKEDGVTPINAPQAIQRTPIPGELIQGLAICDQMIQSILGVFESGMGQSSNDLSGVAVEKLINQTNSAGMPYLVNYMAAITQAAQVIVDIMPTIYSNPRLLPMMDKQGKKTYGSINGYDQNSLDLNYEPGTLNIVVEAGTNYDVRKAESVQMMALLSKSFPAFAQLMDTQGLPILLNNLDINGKEELVEMAQNMLKQAQQQKGQQPSPAQIEQAKLQQKAQEMAQKMQIEQAKLQAEAQKDQMDFQLEKAQQQIDRERLEIERQGQFQDDVQEAQQHHDSKLMHVDKMRLERDAMAHDTAKALFDHVNEYRKEKEFPEEKNNV